jgi:predicted CXXCH cytochrome family protein
MRAVIFIAVLLIFTVAVAFSEDIPSEKRDCGICHVSHMSGMYLVKPLSELCTECHSDRIEADHRVDIVPSMDVGGLPLDSAGRMTCTTCHDTHGTMGIAYMLRAEPYELCNICHKK